MGIKGFLYSLVGAYSIYLLLGFITAKKAVTLHIVSGEIVTIHAQALSWRGSQRTYQGLSLESLFNNNVYFTSGVSYRLDEIQNRPQQFKLTAPDVGESTCHGLLHQLKPLLLEDESKCNQGTFTGFFR